MAQGRPIDRFALHGRRALVTGGSVGMGRAIAVGLAEAGGDVAIQFSCAADAAVDRAGADQETAAAIAAAGPRSLTIDADFATAGEGRRCVAETARAFGGIDILVICASVQVRQALGAITPEAMADQVAINFAATVELLQATLPGMAERGWGRVLSIGSINQQRPDPELAPYAALKAAQHNLVLNFAKDYAAHGVTLNTLSPGLIATDRNRWRRRDAADWAAIQTSANPMGRAGTPEDVVGAALLFCSPAGDFITGADLPVAGGGQL